MADTTVTIRIDERVKQSFDEFCSDVGMNMSVAVNIFIRTVLREQKLPFTVRSDRQNVLWLRQQRAVREFIQNINAIKGEPLGEEFDEIVSHRFNISRQLDL